MLPWSISFGQVAGLALAAFAVALAAVYLFRRPKNRVVFPSLLILKQLRSEKILKRRIRLPLRYFIEALAFLLIALAAAKPLIGDDAERVALVMDNSLSMKAIAENGTSRFELGKQQAEDLIGELDSSTLVDLYLSSPSLSLQLDAVSKGRALRELNRLRSSLAGDVLDQQLSDLVISDRYKKIFVVTDYDLNVSADPKGPSSTHVRVSQVNLLANNVFFTAGRFKPKSIAEAARIEGTIAYSGSGTIKVELGLKARTSITDGKLVQVDSLPLTIEAPLAPSKPVVKDFSFELNDTAPIYNISIEPVGDSKSKNAISDDDQLWLTSSSEGLRQILLVSPGSTTAKDGFGLADVPGFSVSTVSPEVFKRLSETELNNYELIIFHRSAPLSLPKQSALLILPPPGNPIVPVSQTVSDPIISSWSESHPLNLYLRYSLFEPRKALILEPPIWARGIVNTNRGPIVIAGENQGRRIVASGVELLPFEAEGNRSSSILLLNTLGWLRGSEGLGRDLVVGGTFRLIKAPGIELRDPFGQKVEAAQTTIGQKEYSSYSLATAGVYLRKLSKSQILPVAVNVLAPVDSDTSRLSRKFVTIPRSRGSIKSDVEESDLTVWLLYAALLILLLETFAFSVVKRPG